MYSRATWIGDLSESHICNNGEVVGFDALDCCHLTTHAYLLLRFGYIVVYDRPAVVAGPKLAKQLLHGPSRLTVSFCLEAAWLRGAGVSNGAACSLRVTYASWRRGARHFLRNHGSPHASESACVFFWHRDTRRVVLRRRAWPRNRAQQALHSDERPAAADGIMAWSKILMVPGRCKKCARPQRGFLRACRGLSWRGGARRRRSGVAWCR